MSPSPHVPGPGQLVLDHIGLFVPDRGRASDAMARLGFALTPFTPQRHSLGPGLPTVPAGTGNRCVMFERGYVEILTPIAGGPLADQLRAAMARYTGAHLIAFGTNDAQADHAALESAGFAPLPFVSLERTIGTEDGEGLARFSVVRVPPGTMAEGRIQFCQHHTPDLPWQPRWMVHPNRVQALEEMVLCVADPDEAAQRFARFTGRQAGGEGRRRWLNLDRGRLTVLDPDGTRAALGDIRIPALPFMAAVVMISADLDANRQVLASNDVDFVEPAPGTIVASALPDLGVTVVFRAGSTPG